MVVLSTVVRYKLLTYIKSSIRENMMIKTIKVTSLIGLILEAFLSFLFLLFFVGSVSGISHSEIRTTINEQTTTKSTEMSSLIFNWIFGVLMVASFISFIIGFTALKLMTKKTTMSAVFYIIGGVVSLNLITIVAWMVDYFSCCWHF